MTYLDLREARSLGAEALFHAACGYSQQLWLRRLPGRAILALCRALYLDPRLFQQPVSQPFRAYTWMLTHYDGLGYLGNPRVSFANQGARLSDRSPLKKSRAWAMWHLTCRIRPALPGPDHETTAPSVTEVARILDRQGHKGEGGLFLEAFESLD